MKTIEDKQNPLLKRREVKVIIEAEKNPNMQEALKTISKQFKSEEEAIAINQIKGKFGRNTFLIIANIYNSKEDKDKTEPKQKVKKGKAGEEKKPEKPEEKPAGEPAEQKSEEKKEKPAEENKEETA